MHEKEPTKTSKIHLFCRVNIPLQLDLKTLQFVWEKNCMIHRIYQTALEVMQKSQVNFRAINFNC